jgi:hypothetical protein
MRELDRPLAKRDQILQTVLGSLFLFDAVPFLAFPHFVAPPASESVTAQIFWLKNRDPAHWRDAWQIDHNLGKYIISDRPMTEEQWTRERATLIDVTPEKKDE